MKKALVVSFLLLTAFLSGCVVETTDPNPDATLTISNRSDYAIYEINITDVGDPTWGPNLLGLDILLPDERITVEVVCDFYDVRVIDEDAVTCELYDLDLCFDDSIWVIDNVTLDSCLFN